MLYYTVRIKHAKSLEEANDRKFSKKRQLNKNRGIYKFCKNKWEMYKFSGNRGIYNMYHWLREEGRPCYRPLYNKLHRFLGTEVLGGRVHFI